MLQSGLKLALDDVRQLISDFSGAFTPPLLEGDGIEEYAKKLSDKAFFSLLTEEGNTQGFVAYYLNYECKQLYITLIAVATECQQQGHGRTLIEEMERVAADLSFSSIALEVVKTNVNAHKFYLNLAFVEEEDRGRKWLMCKCLVDYAPVLIPTLCRYEHFKRCVESLARCTYATQTDLIIGLDYPLKESHWDGYRKICEYIPKIVGFKRVICLKREKNFGASKNIISLYDWAWERYDTVIASEDDNEFSPCFLDFMNKCLRAYEDNPRVRSVCGYTQVSYAGEKSPLVFSYDNSAWGMGIWKSKETEYVEMFTATCNETLLKSWRKSFHILKCFPACLQMFMNMIQRGGNYGDTKRSILNVLNDTYQVKPSVSMVRNWGNDGTGLNCQTVDDSFARQEIQTATTFELNADTPITMSDHVKKAQFYVGLPKPKLLAWMKIAKIVMRFVFFRSSKG